MAVDKWFFHAQSSLKQKDLGCECSTDLLLGGIAHLMLPPEQDLERRRPVWKALADLFLDTKLDDGDYGYSAKRIIASCYTPVEVRAILWDEVFPAVEFNLRHPAGEWVSFDAEWLQERILSPGRGSTVVERFTSALPVIGTATIVRTAWAELLRFLPDDFGDELHAAK